MNQGCFEWLCSQSVGVICEEGTSLLPGASKEGGEQNEGEMEPSKGDFGSGPHSRSWPRRGALGFRSLVPAIGKGPPWRLEMPRGHLGGSVG